MMDLISTYAKLIRPRGRSIILFLVSIMTFVWRAGTADERTGPTASFAQALAPRIIISAVLAVGALYFVLVVQTFARYGDLMDRRWRERVLTQYLASRTMSPRPPPPPRAPSPSRSARR